MKRFKDAEKQRRYDAYIKNAETLRRNINAADRRLFWFARFGAKLSNFVDPNMYGYPIACAGRDLFKKHGSPDFDVPSRFGTVAEAVNALNKTKRPQ